VRIGIDARPLREARVGIGNYVHGLVKLLPLVGPGNEYFLYSNRAIDPALPDVLTRSHALPVFRMLPGTLWLRARGSQMMRRDRLDIFWSTSPLLPAFMSPGVKKVVTVYDLVWRLFPHTMSRRGRLFFRLFSERAVRDADLVVTISRSTADDLIELLGIAPGKVTLIYPGISDIFAPLNRARAAEFISKKYGISPDYMAAVGTVEPRKNLALLPEVLRILKQKGQLKWPLAIVGAAGWKSSNLFRSVRTARLTENEIRFLGYIPREDLPFFYAGAQAFLFTSLYEGFGFPPLEAMACGTPVIASSAKCMPEVLGDAALLQSPYDAEGFAAALIRLSSDEALRNSLRTAGFEQARKFRWEQSAAQLLASFERLASSGPAQDRPEKAMPRMPQSGGEIL
jgi:glycosyltransferase involved in cell wall biosynthesis